jgi:hypothetical protein
MWTRPATVMTLEQYCAERGRGDPACTQLNDYIADALGALAPQYFARDPQPQTVLQPVPAQLPARDEGITLVRDYVTDPQLVTEPVSDEGITLVRDYITDPQLVSEPIPFPVIANVTGGMPCGEGCTLVGAGYSQPASPYVGNGGGVQVTTTPGAAPATLMRATSAVPAWWLVVALVTGAMLRNGK